MPVPYIKKLAKKHRVSVSTAEGRWEAAKEQAKKNNKEDNFSYITGIFKQMMHEAVKSMVFSAFLHESQKIDYLYEGMSAQATWNWFMGVIEKMDKTSFGILTNSDRRGHAFTFVPNDEEKSVAVYDVTFDASMKRAAVVVQLPNISDSSMSMVRDNLSRLKRFIPA